MLNSLSESDFPIFTSGFLTPQVVIAGFLFQGIGNHPITIFDGACLVCKDEELPELIGFRMGKAQTLHGLALTKKPQGGETWKLKMGSLEKEVTFLLDVILMSNLSGKCTSQSWWIPRKFFISGMYAFLMAHG